MIFLLSLLIPAISFAQAPTPPQEQEFQLPAFTEGLHTRYSANVIPDNALSEALNVLVDEDTDGVIVRRNGRSKCNSTPVEGAKSFRGLYTFDASDGTRYQVGLSSETLWQNDGDCVWQQLTPPIAGLSATREMECVQGLGKLWCANGAVVVWWDGVSSGTAASAPLGSLIDIFRNRVVMGKISGAQSQYKMSGELDGEDWTLNTLSTSPVTISVGGVNDGNIISCMMGVYNDAYIIGKEDSIWALYGFDYTDFALRELSREVGCIEQRTVKEKNGCLYWLSRRGLERMCGNKIDRVSDPVRDLLDTIVATAGNERSILDTTQSDFQDGNLAVSGPRATMSATISPGSVVPSSWSSTDSSLSDFSDGVYDRLIYAGDGVALSSTTRLWDDFSDGNYTSSPNWEQLIPPLLASVAVTGGKFRFSASASASDDFLYAYMVAYDPDIATSTYLTYKVQRSASTRMTGSVWWNGVRISETYSPAALYLLDSSAVLISSVAIANSSSEKLYEVFRDTSTNVMDIHIDGTSVLTGDASSTIVYSTAVILVGAAVGSSGDYVDFDDVWSGYASSGSVISATFDTGISTTVAGPVDPTTEIPSGSYIFYDLRSSTSPNNDLWSDWSASSQTTTGANIKRYWQYRTRMSTERSDNTPVLKSITISAATTGYFISSCKNPGTSITSWGNFTCNTVPNGGSMTFWVSTGTDCGAAISPTTATWTSQVNNSVIAMATAPFIAYRVLFDLDSATEAPTLQDCTIAWNEGETRPPAAAAIYRDRYYLSYSSSTSAGATNDHILVLDKNDKWTLFDNHFCYSLGLYERKLYCGSAVANGYTYLLDSGKDDDGGSYTSTARTKAFAFGSPDRRKSFRQLGLELEPEQNDSDSISIASRYYLDRSTTSISMGSADLGEDPGYLLWAEYPFPTSGSTAGRWLQLEFSATGTNQPFRIFGGRLKYSYLRPQ